MPIHWHFFTTTVNSVSTSPAAGVKDPWLRPIGPLSREHPAYMSDLAYTATLIGGFTAVALVLRGIGMALNAGARREERRSRSVK